MYKPEHLQRWTKDDPAIGGCGNYIGSDMGNCYIAPIVRHPQMPDMLEDSNWEVISEELDKLVEHEESGEHNFGHWAMDYDLYLIHESDEKALICADEWAKVLADYPVADEMRYSEMEFERAIQWWKDMGLPERARMCKKHGVSIFAARREDEIPDNSYLWEDLTVN